MAIYQSQYTGNDIDKVVGELGNGLIKGEGEQSLVQTNNKVLQGDINDQNQLNAILKQEKNRALGNYSTALGYQTNTGCLVYRIYEIDYTSAPGYYILTIGDDSQIKPAYRGEDNETDNQQYYRQGDIVTIRLDGNYDEVSIIETIENNQIKVKSFPVLAKDSEDGKSQSLKPKLYASSGGDINSLRVNKKRNGGYVSIGSSCSVAMGYQSIAGGGYSYAEGLRTQAMGKYAHAEGKDTQALAYASHSEGSETQVTGSQSHVEGARNVVTGFSAHAEGEGTKASGNKSHAEGAGVMNANGTQVVKYLEAKGTGSHAEGYSTLAEGSYSHAEGSNTKASGHSSHAEGMSHTYKKGEETKTIQLEASGEGAHAEGSGTVASGKAAHAEGSSFTNSNGTIVLPQTASGEASHVEGIGNTASGKASHAEGQNTKALGAYSHVEGRDGKTNTEAEGAHVEGLNTIATLSYQHVQGKHNVEDNEKKYAHIVGNGKSANERSNAHTLDWNGNAWFAGIIKLGGESYNKGSTEIATLEDINNLIDGAPENLNTLKEIANGYEALNKRAQELENKVTILEEEGVEVVLTDEQLDTIVTKAAEKGFELKSLKDGIITNWFTFQ